MIQLEKITANINRTNRKVNRFLDAFLRNYDITPEQWNVLNQLNSYGQATQKKLAEIVDKDQPTMTRIIDLLERKQLTRRSANVKDRRSFIIEVTHDGQSLLQSINPELEKQFAKITFADMTDQQLLTLNHYLDHIKNNLEKLDF